VEAKGTLSATASRAEGSAADVILQDDFSGALSAGTGTALWRLREVGSFPSGDGIVTTGPEGLAVVPTATNPATGDPAFANAPAPFGEADHLRWALTANRGTATGFPGFPIGADGRLTVTARLSVRGYGLDGHPYGPAVRDPRRDLRIGAGMLICVDLETGVVFDFIVTDGCVFAVYERLALPGTGHAAFSYVVPVLDREPGDVHSLSVSYDAAGAAARWLVGESEVLMVDRVGYRALDSQYLRRDNDLPEQAAAPRQMTCGLGLFTDRVWGQGIRLTVRSIELRSGRGAAARAAERLQGRRRDVE